MKLTALTRIATHTHADMADVQQALLRVLDAPAHGLVDPLVDVRPLPHGGVTAKGRATKPLAANLRVRLFVSIEPTQGTVLGEIQERVGAKWAVRRVRSIELVASATESEAREAIDLLTADLTLRSQEVCPAAAHAAQEISELVSNQTAGA